MDSPLLLQLLTEKIKEEKGKDLESLIQYCSCKKSPFEPCSTLNDSLDSLSSGRISNRYQYLSSPLFDGAKQALHLRAREVGWVKDEEFEDKCAFCSLQGVEKYEETNETMSSISPVWLAELSPRMENQNDMENSDTYTDYLRQILSLALDDNKSVESVQTQIEPNEEPPQKETFVDILETFDIQCGQEYEREIYCQPYPIKKKTEYVARYSSTRCQRSGWLKKICSFANRKEGSKFPCCPVQFDTIRELQTEESASTKELLVSLRKQSNGDPRQINKIHGVLAAGPQGKSSPKFKPGDIIEYGLAS